RGLAGGRALRAAEGAGDQAGEGAGRYRDDWAGPAGGGAAAVVERGRSSNTWISGPHVPSGSSPQRCETYSRFDAGSQATPPIPNSYFTLSKSKSHVA